MKSGHPELSDEVRQCVSLGTNVCPAILLDNSPRSYVMERLDPAAREPDLLREMEQLLLERVWHRDPIGDRPAWRTSFGVKYLMSIPGWVDDETPCLTHGDPTVSNALRRGSQLILCDPAPRPYAPEFASVDRGKLLQSLAGWETMAYGWDPVAYEPPRFVDDPELLSRAVWWLGAHVTGVLQRELRRPTERAGLRKWCGRLIDACWSARL